MGNNSLETEHLQQRIDDQEEKIKRLEDILETDYSGCFGYNTPVLGLQDKVEELYKKKDDMDLLAAYLGIKKVDEPARSSFQKRKKEKKDGT